MIEHLPVPILLVLFYKSLTTLGKWSHLNCKRFICMNRLSVQLFIKSTVVTEQRRMSNRAYRLFPV